MLHFIYIFYYSTFDWTGHYFGILQNHVFLLCSSSLGMLVKELYLIKWHTITVSGGLFDFLPQFVKKLKNDK